MKIRFKEQEFQKAAVQAVVDCFNGQPLPSTLQEAAYVRDTGNAGGVLERGYKNTPFVLTEEQLLENIKTVQNRHNLPVSQKIDDFQAITQANTVQPLTEKAKTILKNIARLHLDIEMETGTGKTYCYIRTMFELNKQYGWNKFIIVVPSIAIREGVAKTLQMTAEHFLELYQKKARFFIYNSKDLTALDNFSSNTDLNVMVINVQAFNATGKDNRRIYEELDEFQSRRPIDVIKANNPILIIDEPQKMEGDKTLESLKKFEALMVLRYSATHRRIHNKIYRLDALDAYTQKLVKKIAVRGIEVSGLSGITSYLYAQSIELSAKAPPRALLEFEVQLSSGKISRTTRKVSKGDNVFELSHGLEQYRGFMVSEISALTNTISFTNGVDIGVGMAHGDVNEGVLRRIQIREAIRAHLEKERVLFARGIKVLSLFFIDEVAKYRDYTAPDDKGDYARIFEEEYTAQCAESVDLYDDPAWKTWLKSIEPAKTHNGYFSVDKKTRRLVDPSVSSRGDNAGLSDDSDAYDLILKDKERLLSLNEPVRFIFSHSALREGWDNPNVFVICILKNSDNTISRRQEVGRGMRLCVDQTGERIDTPALVHDVNVLTIVANESYGTFVAGLQRDISESLALRPRHANKEYFVGKTIATPSGPVVLDEKQAKALERYLSKNEYIDDDDDCLTELYHDHRKNGVLAVLPADLQPLGEVLFDLVDSVTDPNRVFQFDDETLAGTTHLKPNQNLQKKEFLELWKRINHNAAYTVEFDEAELIENATRALDRELRIEHLRFTVQHGEQAATITADDLKNQDAFSVRETQGEYKAPSVGSTVTYDLVGKIAHGTDLIRKSVATILSDISPKTFSQFKANPESFIAEAIRLINEQKAATVVEHLVYHPLEGEHTLEEIFVAQKFDAKALELKKHVYDFVATDSSVERDFVQVLDTSTDVVVYAKLPKGFTIPTPVGEYNPDWAIAFEEGNVKHMYFVAETKGDMSTMQLKKMEEIKIKCAEKFFEKINEKFAPDTVKYQVITSYSDLMNAVR